MVCSECGDDKLLSEFYKGKKQCKACRTTYMRSYRKTKHPYDKKRQTRNSNLKRKFGITVDEYDEMLFGQGGKCAICGEEQKGKKELAVDHDHTTGKIRELLCF